MDKDRVRDRLRRFEGVIDYLYCCTGAEVTIGVGHAIFSAEDAGALHWNTSPHQAGADWTLVKNSYKEGAPASFYRNLTKSRMADEDINLLCDADIDKYERQLRSTLPKCDSYPEDAQEALFDMGYNLGVAGLMKFKNMLAAVDRSDGPGAAKESHRKGIQDSRNDEIYDLFFGAWGTPRT